LNELVLNQLYSFIFYIGIGILIVLIFDIFRVLRKSFKTSNIITFIEDIIFTIISGTLLIISIFKFNNGEIRIYIFIGIVLGSIIYIATISKYFIKINICIINTVKKMVRYIVNIITTPFILGFKVLRKVFLKPISFFFINFRNYFTNIKKIFIHIRGKNKI